MRSCNDRAMKLTTQAVRFGNPSYRNAAKLLKTVFPKKERIPAFLLLIGTARKTIHFTAFYDGDTFIGLLYAIENAAYYFMLYPAVDPAAQSKGYGGMILDYAYAQAEQRSIILNTEPLDASADNAEQRRRRIAFYKRHGFSMTGYGFTSDGVQYVVLSSDLAFFDVKKCEKMFCGVTLKRMKGDADDDKP